MAIALSDINKLRKFERGIADLIEKSALQRADRVLKRAINRCGSEDLRKAAEVPADDACIDGWDQLCADVLEADGQFRQRGDRGVALVQLSLVNRQEGNQLVEELKVERKFYDRPDLNQYGGPTGSGISPVLETERPINLTGLEAIMVVQRRRFPSGDMRSAAEFRWWIDNILSGLLLIVRYHQAVDRYLISRGLPIAASLIVQMDHVAWPMEAGVEDFGPQIRRHIAQAEHESKPFDAAADILAERTGERRSNFQKIIADMVAEYREHYRLIRMFPFYRFLGRNKLGEMLNCQLGVACYAQDLPEQGVGWRMSKRDFERFLRQLVEALNPSSVEDALDTRHVNNLHGRWLEIVGQKDFNLGSMPSSLFELNLGWALKFGGPIVRDRWERAKPYSVDR